MCSRPFRPRRSRLPLPDCPLWSRVVGVCQYPDSFAMLTGAHGIRSEHTPFRIAPQVGQVSKYVLDPVNKQSCNVLHCCNAGS